MRRWKTAWMLSLALLGAGCADDTDDASTNTADGEITVDTSTPEARRQYEANATFASSYTARCLASTTTKRPRVLVTGFGRFMTIENNATGRIVSALVPEARYPETHAPAAGEIDLPEPQLSVAMKTMRLDGVGDVDVCAMILPVSWDLAAILIAKEADAFRPSFVMMNGVAGWRQPLWLELGATNRASRTVDGSNELRPAVGPGQDYAKLVESARASEDAQGNLLSWTAVERAARSAIEAHAAEQDGNTTFGDVVHGVNLAGFPRDSNTYLCNNVTYVTGWLMSHPGRQIRLLRASVREPGRINDVPVRIRRNLASVPRVFVHWPSDLADKHHEAAADVMRSILAAQLNAVRDGDAPTAGDNALADPSLASDGTFF